MASAGCLEDLIGLGRISGAVKVSEVLRGGHDHLNPDLNPGPPTPWAT